MKKAHKYTKKQRERRRIKELHAYNDKIDKLNELYDALTPTT